MAKRCSSGCRYEETRRDRRRPRAPDFPDDSISTRKLFVSRNTETEGKNKIWPHHFHKSTECVPHMEKVLSIVGQKDRLSSRDKMKDLDVNAAIWSFFMSVTLQAAVQPWYRQDREFEIYQQSISKIIETVVSSDSEADR